MKKFSSVVLSSTNLSAFLKFYFAVFILVAYVPASAQQCAPISSFSCPAVVKNLPLTINFNGSEGGLQDKNGAATGFTMVDKPSAPLVAPTYSNTPGYEPSKLEISAGKLIISTTAGISYLNPAQSAKTNSQVNALGVGFVAPSEFNIQTTLVQPNAGTGKSEQAGLWFGLDEDNFVKLVVVSTGSGNSKVEMRKEVAAMSSSADVKGSASMILSSSLVNLKFVVNKDASTIEGFYSINGGAQRSVGILTIPQGFTTGKTLSDGATQNITFAGIFATHRSAATALNFSFEDFKVEEVKASGPLPNQCSPISSFSCPEVVKNLPFTLNFTGSEGGLQDKRGAATGFIMVDSQSAPLVAPTFSNIPGYEPSKLEILGGNLIITTTAGTNYLNPAQSARTNSQVNALGVGFVAPSEFTIQTTLVQPNAGAGKAEQAGIWFGLDEDNYVKLVVFSAGGGNSKFEMRKEIASMSTSADVKTTGSMILSSSLVNLKFVVNKVASTIEGFYSINGGTELSVGTLSIPQSFTAGKTLSDGVTGNITFAGIFATHRNSATALNFSFEDFKVEAVGIPAQSNALLFVENLDRFPSNDLFVFSRIQIPWSRDKVTYNANHDSLTVRIHNKGINNLVIKDLSLSNNAWSFVKLKGVDYVATLLPLTITSGTYADLTVKFVATDAGTRVKILQDTLTIVSNDDKFPSKSVFFSGIWQKQGEGNNEPYAHEIISAFGFKTKVGYNHDPDKGDSTKLKGDEIRPSYFVRADASLPVEIRQMGAYHGCCTQSERIMWHVKGSDSLTTIVSHIGRDGQSLLPRKGTPNTPAEGSFNPSTAFGFKIGNDWTDARKNPLGKIGIRVWKAYDSKGNIIPNSYIIGNDYLGSPYTNYDYNDNVYFIKNIKPEKGSAFYSALNAAPSALDFGEKILQSANSLQLNLSSLGLTYADGTKDPVLTISSVAITGENKSEFAAAMPVKTILNPQENTTLTVSFNPVTEGLKIADLLIYYNNSLSPLRVPLYGIAKATGTTVTPNYRVNSGSATPLTINGKTWSADNQYSFDNLEPFKNNSLTKISGTDEDALYLKEQSSNGDKKPFRYEFPVANGEYVVRLHFAEIYWGVPGGSLAGGAGSRIMSVSLENQLRLINFDVAQEIGGAAALVKNIPVTVTDGKLNINFSATVNRPMVNAVEIYSFSKTASIANKEVLNNTIAKNNTVLISSDQAISNRNNFDKPKVYPNPLHNNFTIEIPGKYKGDYTVQIVDVFGRIYKIGETLLKPGGSTIKVDISKQFLKPGVYFLSIHSDVKKTDVIKLIVE